MQEITLFISHYPLLTAATIAVFILVVIVELLRAKQNAFNIGPVKVTQLINRENAVVIDIRQPELYRKSHIIDAHSMNSGDLLKDTKKIDKFRSRPLIIVANSHHESQKIAALLLKQGYNAFSLHGGMRAWMEAQMPLVGEQA
jgi:rhodanese-related sulfurtransferase